MKKGRLLVTLVFSSLSVASLSGCNGAGITIRFVNYDDSLLLELTGLKRGDEVVYDVSKPMHFDDNENYYVFKGWDKEIGPAKRNATYKAEFDAYPLTNVAESPVDYTETLPSSTNDGMALHAFCWSYKDIEAQLPFIEAAGYKAIQISPVQVPKSNGASWWAFYQPLSFTIADGDQSPLGTKAELASLCTKAGEKGIDIIADIVFNHMANINDDELLPDGTPKVCPDVALYEPTIYDGGSNNNPYFHHVTRAEGSGAETQLYPYGGLPDLNTANKYVQERALALLEECIDVGIDGFRFDAAKHIETPDDPENPSDFWPCTLGVAKEYYKTKNAGKELYAYGEVLGTPTHRNINVYTKMMNVNDDGFASAKTFGISDQKASYAYNAKYKIDNSSLLMSYVESHDSYIDSSNPWSNEFNAKAWSVLASRKNYHGLYLARPDSHSSPTVGTIGDYFYRDESIGAVNRFHNRFVDANEEMSYDGSIFINERFSDNDKGALVTNFGEKKKIIVDFAKLGTDVYYDQMTGKSVTVRNGHATLELDDSGIVVLTKSKNGPYPELTIGDRSALFVDNKSVVVDYNNASTATYQINGGTPVAFNSGDTITFTKDQAVDSKVQLTINVSNDKHSYSETVTYKVTTIVPGYYNIVNVSADHLANYDFHIWAWKKGEDAKWIDDLVIQDGKILIDTATLGIEGMVVARFQKGHTITNRNAWDSAVIKQTGDITGAVLEQGYYDGTTF